MRLTGAKKRHSACDVLRSPRRKPEIRARGPSTKTAMGGYGPLSGKADIQAEAQPVAS